MKVRTENAIKNNNLLWVEVKSKSMLSGKQIDNNFKHTSNFAAFVTAEMDALTAKLSKGLPATQALSAEELRKANSEVERGFQEGVRQVFQHDLHQLLTRNLDRGLSDLLVTPFQNMVKDYLVSQQQEVDLFNERMDALDLI